MKKLVRSRAGWASSRPAISMRVSPMAMSKWPASSNTVHLGSSGSTGTSSVGRCHCSGARPRNTSVTAVSSASRVLISDSYDAIADLPQGGQRLLRGARDGAGQVAARAGGGGAEAGGPGPGGPVPVLDDGRVARRPRSDGPGAGRGGGGHSVQFAGGGARHQGPGATVPVLDHGQDPLARAEGSTDRPGAAIAHDRDRVQLAPDPARGQVRAGHDGPGPAVPVLDQAAAPADLASPGADGPGVAG